MGNCTSDDATTTARTQADRPAEVRPPRFVVESCCWLVALLNEFLAFCAVHRYCPLLLRQLYTLQSQNLK